MPGIPFIKEFKFDYGTAMEVTPLIRRVVAHNPSPFTFKGTGTYIIGHGKVAIVDPGPDQQDHIDAVLQRGARRDGDAYLRHPYPHRPCAGDAGDGQGDRRQGLQLRPASNAGRRADRAGGRLLLRARHQAQRRRRGARRRLERRGGLHAGPHLQPSLLRREGGQRAALGRPRDGLVDGGDLAARRQHGRLFRVACASSCRAHETLYIPTHGAEIRNPHPFVEAYIEHRLGREAQIMARLKEGPQTIPQMVAKNYADVPHAPARRRRPLDAGPPDPDGEGRPGEDRGRPGRASTTHLSAL